GHASIGGLSVQLTLLDSSGTTTVSVPRQSIALPPNNYVQIDRTTLYYETVFVDPNVIDPVTHNHPPVAIVPGEQVHVVTSGIDPSSGQRITEDKLIAVDDVQAWTSYQTDTVTGQTSLANAPVIITTASSYLSLSNYLTPGTFLTYATMTADGSGSFRATK